MPEKLALEQGLSDSGAVDRNERLPSTAALNTEPAAISSLPVPLSPSSSTQQSLGAALSTSLRTSRIAWDTPTISGRSISACAAVLMALINSRSSQDLRLTTLGRILPLHRSPTRSPTILPPLSDQPGSRISADCAVPAVSAKSAVFAASQGCLSKREKSAQGIPSVYPEHPTLKCSA